MKSDEKPLGSSTAPTQQNIHLLRRAAVSAALLAAVRAVERTTYRIPGYCYVHLKVYEFDMIAAAAAAVVVTEAVIVVVVTVAQYGFNLYIDAEIVRSVFVCVL